MGQCWNAQVLSGAVLADKAYNVANHAMPVYDRHSLPYWTRWFSDRRAKPFIGQKEVQGWEEERFIASPFTLLERIIVIALSRNPSLSFDPKEGAAFLVTQ